MFQENFVNLKCYSGRIVFPGKKKHTVGSSSSKPNEADEVCLPRPYAFKLWSRKESVCIQGVVSHWAENQRHWAFDLLRPILRVPASYGRTSRIPSVMGEWVLSRSHLWCYTSSLPNASSSSTSGQPSVYTRWSGMVETNRLVFLDISTLSPHPYSILGFPKENELLTPLETFCSWLRKIKNGICHLKKADLD